MTSQLMRLLSRLAAPLGLVLGAGATAAAAPSSPPAAWTAYAEEVQRRLPAWLAEDSEPALRLQADLAGAADLMHTPAPILLRVWVDGDGALSRVEAPEVPASAGEALAGFLGQRRLEPPPAGLPMPIRLRLRFAWPAEPVENNRCLGSFGEAFCPSPSSAVSSVAGRQE